MRSNVLQDFLFEHTSSSSSSIVNKNTKYDFNSNQQQQQQLKAYFKKSNSNHNSGINSEGTNSNHYLDYENHSNEKFLNSNKIASELSLGIERSSLANYNTTYYSFNYAILVIFSGLVSIIFLSLFLAIMVYCCLIRKTNAYKKSTSFSDTTNNNNQNYNLATHHQIHHQHSSHLNINHRHLPLNSSTSLNNNSLLTENYNSIGYTNINTNLTGSTQSTLCSINIGPSPTNSVNTTAESIHDTIITNPLTSTFPNTYSKTPIKEISISLPLAKPSLNPLKPQLSIESKMKTKTLCERRGSNNSLSLTLNPIKKKIPVTSPTKESTTLEYLTKATRALSIHELIEISNNKNNLYNEFYYIPFNHPETTIMGSGIKNRYKTIVPNELTRVKLPIRNNDPSTTYINANYIYSHFNISNINSINKINNETDIEQENFHCQNTSSFSSSLLSSSTSSLSSNSLLLQHKIHKPAYIASQGPMSNTINDFWLMIWNESVSSVVMITKLIERNKNKCELYIPEHISQSIAYDNIVVTVKQINYFQDYEVRQLNVHCENETRIVYHYWYTAWPDHNLPENRNALIQLIKQVEAIKNYDDKTGLIGKGPVLVHCSAGVGRTGCFIAISIGIRQIEMENLVDIVKIVCHLRKDRGGMIQTLEQYEFIYQVLAYYCIYYKKYPYTISDNNLNNSNNNNNNNNNSYSSRSPSMSVSSPSSTCLQSSTTSSSFSFNTQTIQ